MMMFSLIVVATDAATDDATNDRFTLFATAPRLFEIENRPIDDIDAP